MMVTDDENMNNCIQIVDLYWDRIYLHIKIEGFEGKSYKFALYNKKGQEYFVKVNETCGEIILNITNINNQQMLDNGEWHIAYLNPDYDADATILEDKNEICKWIDVPVKIETCYKMKNMDKVFRYSDDSYAYIFTFSPSRKLDKLICIIKCTFMVKNISPQKRWFRCESVKISKAEISTVARKVEADTAYQAIEKVELIAGKITWKVTPIKPDNTKDGVVEASFDQTING